MRRIIILTVLLALAWAGQTWAQTPTPVIAATPAADAGDGSKAQLAGRIGGEVFEKQMVFEGGTQIGSTAAGASFLTFVARGTCVVDPSSLAVGVEEIESCAVTGVAAGDAVFASIRNTEDVTNVIISRAKAQAGAIHLTILSPYGTMDAGALTIDYLVVR